MFFWWKYKDNFTARQIRKMANAVRALSVDQVQEAQSGHPGAPLGMADIITTIYANHLRFNPTIPHWPDRDRFVLSAGHASAMLYATLHLSGYEVSIDDLRNFRQLGAPTQGHPEYGALPGIETSTGALGQGIANAVGMAMAAKIKGTDSRVYCLCSDGDLMEGISQEAISLSGLHKLNNLVVLWDNNGISIDGAVAWAEDIPARFLAAGWATIEVNGLKPRQINRALHIAKRMKKPTLIACKTTIGYMSERAGTAAAHGAPLSVPDAVMVLKKLRPPFAKAFPFAFWTSRNKSGGKPEGDSFTIPPKANILWTKLQNIKKDTTAAAVQEPMQDPLDVAVLARLTPSIGPESTRKIFGRAITIATGQRPKSIIGGSADLAESTFARPVTAKDVTAADPRGNYIHYGVREHAMGGIMNGLALSGLRPYGSTFLVFSDYMRPAIRLSAIMGLPVIYVFTHDSIAVGEDGITHQPTEHLASLRLIPNLRVMRPANYTEVAVCLELAFRRTDGPTALILSRQDLPIFETNARPDDVEKGGYVISSPRNMTGCTGAITIIATGSEVPLALEVQKILESHSKFVAVKVISMPCVENFRMQTPEYQHEVLHQGKLHSIGRIIIEAGTTHAWHEFSATDKVIGIDTFGMGGKGAEVYKHFGFEASKIAEEPIKAISRHLMKKTELKAAQPAAAAPPAATPEIEALRKAVSAAGYVVMDSPSIDGVRPDIFAIAPDEKVFIGLAATPHRNAEATAAILVNMSQKMQKLFGETLDKNIKIKISFAVFSPEFNDESADDRWKVSKDWFARHKVRALGLGTNPAQMSQILRDKLPARHLVIPRDKDDFAVYSEYISQVADYFNSKPIMK